ncbi:FAD-dependent monooxygenase [Leifsonia poae]|uniref:Oxidoreductase n=1 Tax=Leifsonia poae TaxID=110933 RepID=A0A9W6M0T2_9MICO|nr:FAD-dependent monooxygenase [Leifsonia poae]GLJ77191.1 oxidoreductase [Leifsonia poae]
MRARTVLISGGGIAGATLAHSLGRRGFAVTVVERAAAARSSGNPVDVRGAAVDVAQRMGVMDRLEELSTHVESLRFITPAGRTIARLDIRPRRRAEGRHDVEVPRADLARVLLDAARPTAEFVFGDAIASLHADTDGVDVAFDSGMERRFDIVIGADGLHSGVRRLAFGDEAQFVRHQGLYVGTYPLGQPLDDPTEVVMLNTPGRSASVHPGSGHPLAAFIFRSPADPGFDHRDADQHAAMIREAYRGDGWIVPELLEGLQHADDLYFDAVSQVQLPRWSRGRIALLGDAASSVSLFGEGSSLAMIGAARLANALAETSDAEQAFERFEAEHRPLVRSKQRMVRLAAGLIVPGTRLGIGARNAGVRLSSLGAAWMRRLPSGDAIAG